MTYRRTLRIKPVRFPLERNEFWTTGSSTRIKSLIAKSIKQSINHLCDRIVSSNALYSNGNPTLTLELHRYRPQTFSKSAVIIKQTQLFNPCFIQRLLVNFIAICYVCMYLIVLPNFNHRMLVHGLRLTSHSLNEDVLLCYVMLYQFSQTCMNSS